MSAQNKFAFELHLRFWTRHKINHLRIHLVKISLSMTYHLDDKADETLLNLVLEYLPWYPFAQAKFKIKFQ